jgi:hypothetical protein
MYVFENSGNSQFETITPTLSKGFCQEIADMFVLLRKKIV